MIRNSRGGDSQLVGVLLAPATLVSVLVATSAIFMTLGDQKTTITVGLVLVALGVGIAGGHVATKRSVPAATGNRRQPTRAAQRIWIAAAIAAWILALALDVDLVETMIIAAVLPAVGLWYGARRGWVDRSDVDAPLLRSRFKLIGLVVGALLFGLGIGLEVGTSLNTAGEVSR